MSVGLFFVFRVICFMNTSKGKRITQSICLTPENTAFLKALGKEKNNWLNTLIEKERIDYARFLEATNSLKGAED